jgi:ribosomal protein S18 acetylase RimI-like enzyme
MPVTTPVIRQLGVVDQHRLSPLLAAMAEGIGSLYGPDAAADYAGKSAHLWALNLAHPAVTVLGAIVDRALAGVIVAFRRDGHADIAFLFVGEAWHGRGLEAALVRDLVARLRNAGVGSIVSECVPLGPLELDTVYGALGFTVIPRLLLSASLTDQRLETAGGVTSIPLTRPLWPAAAECLVEAYLGEPGRLLHREMAQLGPALEFIERIHAGAYGAFWDGFARTVLQDGACAAVILGAEAAPGVGFVLQLVTAPFARRQGLARTLLTELAVAFRERGYEKIALGVTANNPARTLYEASGLTLLRTVTAYLWCNPLGHPVAE